MTAGIKDSLRNGYLNDIRDDIDKGGLGSGQGKIKLYTTPRPSKNGAITTQLLIGTPLFGNPSAPNAVAGVLTFNAFTDDPSAGNPGEAIWARITDADDDFVMDVDVGKQFTLDGDLTSGSPIVTNIVDTSLIDTGMQVTGTGIPAGTTVLSVDSGTQVTLTQNATATGTNALTYTTPDADILFNDNNFSVGSTISIASGTITAGNA